MLWYLIPIAFAAEFVDSSLGMGYGTSLTPILLLLGFSPLQVVPAILLSELVTGILAALGHHKVGNVSLRRGSADLKVGLSLGALSLIGAVIGATLVVNLPTQLIKLFIAIIVASMGLIILFRRRKSLLSWKKLAGLGLLAAFNKGVSGGGYGPLVTAGQITSGVEAKSAVGITSLAEAFTCLVGVTTYLILRPAGMDWNLATPLIIGAVASVPLAVLAVKRIPKKRFTFLIGCAVLALGVWSLARLIF